MFATLFGLVILVTSQTPGELVESDVALLKGAGFPTDGGGLVDLVRRQSLTPDMRVRVALWIDYLGRPNFKQRENGEKSLTAEGPLVLVPLFEALKKADEETRRRSDRIIRNIQKSWPEEARQAALRELARQQPAGGLEAALRFIPSASSPGLREGALQILLAYTRKSGRVDPLLLAALDDTQPDTRAAAAFVVAAHGSEEQRGRVRRLLQDKSALVRFQAAHGLLHAADQTAIPPLLDLLADGPLDLGLDAADLLGQLADKNAPQINLDADASNRKAWAAEWQAWWKNKGQKIDLAKVKLRPPVGLQADQLQRLTHQFLDTLFGEGEEAALKMVERGLFFLDFANIAQPPPNLRMGLQLNGHFDLNVRIKRVVPPWQLLAMAHPTDRPDLKQLGPDVWAVCFQFPDGKGSYKGRETLFVRLRAVGGQAMVVGYSRIFSHQDYNRDE